MSKAKCKKCEEKCGKGKASPEILIQLESGYDKLAKSDSPSMLKRFLTREVFDKLKFKKTSFGSTLLDCIQSGLENLDSGIGIYAADPECYSVFADLFDPIIQEYHNFKLTDHQPTTDWGPPNALGNLDPKGEFVVSTRVRCCRTLKGFPFNPCMTEDHYKEIENLMQSTFNNLSGDLKGTYHALTGMSKDVQQKLIDDHYLFKEGDRFLQSANACRFWPTGRGIFYNDKMSFLMWICEEDHLRIMCMQPGGNVGEVYKRLVTAVGEIQKKNEFVTSDRFGYLTFCPTNLGYYTFCFTWYAIPSAYFPIISVSTTQYHKKPAVLRACASDVLNFPDYFQLEIQHQYNITKTASIQFKMAFVSDILNDYLGFTSRLMEQNFGQNLNLENFLQITPHMITKCPAGYLRQWSSEEAKNDAGSIISAERNQFVAKLDVQHFEPDEISVRVSDKNIVTIEGRHEEKPDDHGTIYRHFVRRYLIPDGYDVDKVKSQLSSDGLLSIIVPRMEQNEVEHIEIPVVYTGEPSNVNQNKNLDSEQ